LAQFAALSQSTKHAQAAEQSTGPAQLLVPSHVSVSLWSAPMIRPLQDWAPVHWKLHVPAAQRSPPEHDASPEHTTVQGRSHTISSLHEPSVEHRPKQVKPAGQAMTPTGLVTEHER
jgi:hypothetical protein